MKWKIESEDSYALIITDENSAIIAKLPSKGMSSNKKDANLLAAAPELLDACKRAFDYIDFDCGPSAILMRKILNQAISKAEGRDL